MLPLELGTAVAEQHVADRIDACEARLADVQSRVARLKRRPPHRLGVTRAALVVSASVFLTAAASEGTRVRAPFEVVNEANKVVFTVTDVGDYGFTLKGDGGSIFGGVKVGNSFLRVRAPLQASPSASRAGGGGSVSSGSRGPSDMTTEAVFGQVGGKAPAVTLRTLGKLRLSIAVDGIPSLSMSGGAVNMSESTSGGGLLQLGDSHGDEKVAFVVGKNGLGIVRAQPVGNVGVNVPETGIFRFGTGLPSSEICGVGCSGK